MRAENVQSMVAWKMELWCVRASLDGEGGSVASQEVPAKVQETVSSTGPYIVPVRLLFGEECCMLARRTMIEELTPTVPLREHKHSHSS